MIFPKPYPICQNCFGVFNFFIGQKKAGVWEFGINFAKLRGDPRNDFPKTQYPIFQKNVCVFELFLVKHSRVANIGIN